MNLCFAQSNVWQISHNYKFMQYNNVVSLHEPGLERSKDYRETKNVF